MPRFLFEVAVDTDSYEHARQVMGERLGYDEQYEDEDGVEFDYTVETTGPGRGPDGLEATPLVADKAAQLVLILDAAAEAYLDGESELRWVIYDATTTVIRAAASWDLPSVEHLLNQRIMELMTDDHELPPPRGERVSHETSVTP